MFDKPVVQPQNYMSPRDVMALFKLLNKCVNMIPAISGFSMQDYRDWNKALPPAPIGVEGLSRLAWLKYIRSIFLMLNNIMEKEIKKLEEK